MSACPYLRYTHGDGPPARAALAKLLDAPQTRNTCPSLP